MALCVAFVWHWVCLFVGRVSCVCLFVRLNKLCLAWGLSVCPSDQVIFGTGFVCLSVCTSYVWHGVCLFVRLYKLCLPRALSFCPSEQVMFGTGFVRLYKLCLARGLSVCPSVQLMFGMGFVCSKHSSLIVFGIFGSPEKDCLLVLKRTGYCSRSYILPSCQATAPSLLK